MQRNCRSNELARWSTRHGWAERVAAGSRKRKATGRRPASRGGNKKKKKKKKKKRSSNNNNGSEHYSAGRPRDCSSIMHHGRWAFVPNGTSFLLRPTDSTSNWILFFDVATKNRLPGYAGGSIPRRGIDWSRESFASLPPPVVSDIGQRIINFTFAEWTRWPAVARVITGFCFENWFLVTYIWQDNVNWLYRRNCMCIW